MMRKYYVVKMSSADEIGDTHFILQCDTCGKVFEVTSSNFMNAECDCGKVSEKFPVEGELPEVK